MRVNAGLAVGVRGGTSLGRSLDVDVSLGVGVKVGVGLGVGVKVGVGLGIGVSDGRNVGVRTFSWVATSSKTTMVPCPMVGVGTEVGSGAAPGPHAMIRLIEARRVHFFRRIIPDPDPNLVMNSPCRAYKR